MIGTRRPSDPQGTTGRLCEFLATATLADIPPDVIDRAEHLVLDGIGCGLLAAHLPWSEKAVDVISTLDGDGAATIWGWDRTAPAGAAALLNGTFIQGFELDDYHQFGPLHSEACVLPSVLGTAQHLGDVSGRALLEAVAFGFEIGPRIGMALGGLALVSRGWHSGSVFGTLASAVGAGKLRGLDAVGFEDALGMAATQAAGLMSAQFEAMVKRMHSGLSARNGLYSAALADGGFSGIKRVIERDYGGYALTFSSPEDVDLDRITDALGRRWEIARISVKPPYSCMGGLHSTVDGVLKLVTERQVTADRVAHMRIGVGEAMYKHAGWTLERPAEVIGAQMNLAYAAAVALLDGAAFVPQFSPARLDADDVWDVIDRTEVTWDTDIDHLGEDARWTSRLRVMLTDGTEHDIEIRHPWGGRMNPMTNEQLRDKFRRMVTLVIEDVARVDALEKTILTLRDQPDLGRLAELVGAPVNSPFS